MPTLIRPEKPLPYLARESFIALDQSNYSFALEMNSTYLVRFPPQDSLLADTHSGRFTSRLFILSNL